MFYLKQQAFHNFIQSYRKDFEQHNDPLKALNDCKTDIIYLLTNNAVSHRIRFIICLGINFFKYDYDDNRKEQFFYFSSFCERSLSNLDIENKVTDAYNKIISSVEAFIRFGSGWIIDSIKFIDLHIGDYNPINGGCFIDLPKCLKVKNCIINIKNCDDKCFIYCILAKMFPVKYHRNKASSYIKYLKHLRFSFLNFPVAITQVEMFEKKNNISINIYGYDKNVFPIYLSKINIAKEVNLLLYKKHYFLISNFNRLIHEKNSCSYYCKNCLLGFRRKETLETHQTYCLLNKPQRLRMPTINDNVLKFTAYQKMFKHPFCIFADFECLTIPIQTSIPQSDKSFTVKVQKHEPICYGLFVVDENNKIVYHKYYLGMDCVENFFVTLKCLESKILTYMERNIPLGNINFNKPEICHLCEKKFKTTDVIVRNHSHLSGKFLGFCHKSPCNLNYKLSQFICVVLHGFINYDSHLIFKKISNKFGKKIKVIPINTEKFTTFTIDNLKFIDSYNFLSSSLSKLVNNLKESNFDFPVFNEYFKNVKNSNLLLRKGIFPYDYFNHIDVLREKTLPPKMCFYNKLTEEDISDNEYQHALKVWKKFKCVYFEDYLKIYLFVDCLLLADVFNNFRSITQHNYNLEPAHFLSAPDLTWTAGLKMTDIKLELFTDVNMYLMVEKGIRGGICIIGKRFSECNNPYVLETYDHKKPNKYIVSIDINNLYGFSMTGNLPYSNFKWLTFEEINNFDVMSISCNSEIGYILDVDLEYPPEIHNIHNDLPMAVDHLNITYNNLSPYQKNILKNNGLKLNNNAKKLIPNLNDKTHYVIHYLNLQFYIQQGLKLTKIHKVISFRQSPWLKPYIEFNTLKRKNSKNDFDKSFFKLMINSFFGRSCMNVRKQVDVKIALTERECKNHLSSSALEYFSVISENCVLFKKKRSNLFLNKPIYIGFTVLEFSKLFMYKMYYNVFKENYGENVNLLYMDTDSFTLEITCEDFYKDLQYKLPKIFDFSNYDQNNKLYSKTNESKLGLFKDETRGIPIKEFCGLKPKMYSYIFGNNCKKTAKGIKRSEVQKMNHDMYVSVLKSNISKRCTQHQILSKQHEIHTMLINKKSLCSFYDKKYLLDDGITCLSFGHYCLMSDKRDDMYDDEN